MSTWIGADAVRITRQVQRLHDLGPRPLFELLAELGADHFVRDDLEHLLDRYARLDPGLVAALGGRELKPPVFVVAESGQRSLEANQRVRGAA